VAAGEQGPGRALRRTAEEKEPHRTSRWPSGGEGPPSPVGLHGGTPEEEGPRRGDRGERTPLVPRIGRGSESATSHRPPPAHGRQLPAAPSGPFLSGRLAPRQALGGRTGLILVAAAGESPPHRPPHAILHCAGPPRRAVA
jgi:hypothetical protein